MLAWAAIGEPDSRFRKPNAPGRMIERVMLLDAILDEREFTWLGPAADKRRHFVRHLGDRLEVRDYPHLLFGGGPAKAVRHFPDKLPIGMQPFAAPHVFVYLVTHPSPMDFRLFLLRHTALLRALNRWSDSVVAGPFRAQSFTNRSSVRRPGVHEPNALAVDGPPVMLHLAAGQVPLADLTTWLESHVSVRQSPGQHPGHPRGSVACAGLAS
jgi:hypothetical protein